MPLCPAFALILGNLGILAHFRHLFILLFKERKEVISWQAIGCIRNV